MKSSRDPSSSGSPNLDLLQKLFVQVERAWFDRGDRSVASDLMSKHPDFQKELQEFLGDLMGEFDQNDNAYSHILEAENRVYEWLQGSGIDQALSVAADLRRQSSATNSREHGQVPPPPVLIEKPSQGQQVEEGTSESWLIFLRRQLGRRGREIASIPNVTLEFVSLVSRYPRVIPDRVKATLARLFQERFNLPSEQSLEYLSGPGQVVKRAASRRAPADSGPGTFEEVLERAALSATEKDFWRGCSREADECGR